MQRGREAAVLPCWGNVSRKRLVSPPHPEEGKDLYGSVMLHPWRGP